MLPPSKELSPAARCLHHHPLVCPLSLFLRSSATRPTDFQAEALPRFPEAQPKQLALPLLVVQAEMLPRCPEAQPKQLALPLLLVQAENASTSSRSRTNAVLQRLSVYLVKLLLIKTVCAQPPVAAVTQRNLFSLSWSPRAPCSPFEAHPGRLLSHLVAGVLQSCADPARDQAPHSRECLASAKKQPETQSYPGLRVKHRCDLQSMTALSKSIAPAIAQQAVCPCGPHCGLRSPLFREARQSAGQCFDHR